MTIPRCETIAQWAQILTDASVWQPLIQHICRLNGLAYTRCTVTTVPGSNVVFMLDDCYVVKVFAPFWRDGYDREIAVTRLVSEAHIMPVPEIVASGKVWFDQQEWPYLVSTRLPGIRGGDVWDSIPLAQRVRLAEQFGEMVHRMHELSVEPLAEVIGLTRNWQDYLNQQRESCQDRHRAGLPPHLWEQIPGFLGEVWPLLDEEFIPLVLHCDLTADHLLLTEHDGKWDISGLIDFGDADVGPHEYEFVAVGGSLFVGDKAALRHFLIGYGYSVATLDGRFAQRMLAYTMLHRYWKFHEWTQIIGSIDGILNLDELAQVMWGWSADEESIGSGIY